MAIHHAVSGELISVAPLAAPLGDSQSTTLVLDKHLKVLRLALPAGKQLPEHAVAGPITLYCLDGAVDVVDGSEQR